MYVYSTYNVAVISPSSGFLRDELHGSPSPPPPRRSLQRMGSKAATAASSLTAAPAPRPTPPLPQQCGSSSMRCPGACCHCAAAAAVAAAYNCALQAAAAAELVGLQFIARLRPIVLQFRGVSHSSYLAATDLVNDLLSPFKVTVFFFRGYYQNKPRLLAQERDSV